MTCRFSHDDAAYVFGALSAAERLDFERHLANCGQCTKAVREMAGLPGLLGRVDASVLENPPAEEPVPETLLPSLFREARRSRRRRTFTAAGLAAAAAVIVAAVPVVHSQQGDGGSPRQAGPPASARPLASQARPMAPTGRTPIQASLAMQTVAWGTRLDLTCTYGRYLQNYKLTPSTTYVLAVRTSNGRTEQVGTWQAVDGTMHLMAATAADRADIASVEVRTTDGRVLMRLDA